MSDKLDLYKQKLRRNPTHQALDSFIDPVPTQPSKEYVPLRGSTNERESESTNHEVDLNRVEIIRSEGVRVTKRKKFEQQYTRQTYYIHNDLLTLLNHTAGREKGEKTRIINEALRQYLNASP